jgi:hypothetical protein
MHKYTPSIQDIFSLDIHTLLTLTNDKDLQHLYTISESILTDIVESSDTDELVVEEAMKFLLHIMGKSYNSDTLPFTHDYLSQCLSSSDNTSDIVECLRDHLIRTFLLATYSV